jgi:hypothetical protein
VVSTWVEKPLLRRNGTRPAEVHNMVGPAIDVSTLHMDRFWPRTQRSRPPWWRVIPTPLVAWHLCAVFGNTKWRCGILLKKILPSTNSSTLRTKSHNLSRSPLSQTLGTSTETAWTNDIACFWPKYVSGSGKTGKLLLRFCSKRTHGLWITVGLLLS